MSKKTERKRVGITLSKEDLKKIEDDLTRFREKDEVYSDLRPAVEKRSRIPRKCNGTGPRSKK